MPKAVQWVQAVSQESSTEGARVHTFYVMNYFRSPSLKTQHRVPMHDLHATILHLLGLDSERRTSDWAGCGGATAALSFSKNGASLHDEVWFK